MIKKRSFPYSISDGGFCSEVEARDIVRRLAGGPRFILMGLRAASPARENNLRAAPRSVRAQVRAG